MSLCSTFQTDDATDDDVDGDMDADEEYDSDEKERMKAVISNKLKKDKGAVKTTDPREEEREKKTSRRYDCMFPSRVSLSRNIN